MEFTHENTVIWKIPERCVDIQMENGILWATGEHFIFLSIESTDEQRNRFVSTTLQNRLPYYKTLECCSPLNYDANRTTYAYAWIFV